METLRSQDEQPVRDVALVLSGGGVNAAFMECGFLNRIAENKDLWNRVGHIYGTSAGAFLGIGAQLNTLPQLNELLLNLQPGDVYGKQPWRRIFLLGFRAFLLPQAIEAIFGTQEQIDEAIRNAERKLHVIVTDMKRTPAGDRPTRLFERLYSSDEAAPGEMIQAVIASASVGVFVPPVHINDVLATDGGWVANFPLGYAYDEPDVQAILAFQCLPRIPRYVQGPVVHKGLTKLEKWVSRFRWTPGFRPLSDDLRSALARGARGEPAHQLDVIEALALINVWCNTAISELLANEKDQSIQELATLQAEMRELILHYVPQEIQAEALVASRKLFMARKFPFRHDRLIEPRVTVKGRPTIVDLDAGVKTLGIWSREQKETIIKQGYDLTDQELKRHGLA